MLAKQLTDNGKVHRKNKFQNYYSLCFVVGFQRIYNIYLIFLNIILIYIIVYISFSNTHICYRI